MTEQSEHLNAEPVGEEEPCTWTFRGYRLDPSHFTTAMIHFYRGEVTRCNTWRTRLDATTNWAVVTVGAALTFVFGTPQNPHFVLLLELLLVLNFLYIEARRYQYYALWSYRVHLMETGFLAAMLTSSLHASTDWADYLVKSLQQPAFPITRWESVGRRFQRNYVWLITLLLISWGLKLVLHPTPAADWNTVVERAALGSLHGMWVLTAVGMMYGAVATLAVAAALRHAWRDDWPKPLLRLGRRLRRVVGPLVPEPRRRQRLATIITSHGRQVALQLLTELGRGVTALEGTGMYTSETKDVLLCAVTEVQVPYLEKIVCRADPKAFVIVSPAEDVRGWGFRPFEVPS